MLRCLITWIYKLIEQEEKFKYPDSSASRKEVLSTSVAHEPSCFGAGTRSSGKRGGANELFVPYGNDEHSSSHLF